LVEIGRDLPMQQISCSKSVTFQESVTPKIKKAARQQGSLLFSRENSSNGGKRSRQNFLEQIL
jgi:hypothetical protein